MSWQLHSDLSFQIQVSKSNVSVIIGIVYKIHQGNFQVIGHTHTLRGYLHSVLLDNFMEEQQGIDESCHCCNQLCLLLPNITDTLKLFILLN